MTREEILTMKPGRELDALVAEKVMGYSVLEDLSVRQEIGDFVSFGTLLYYSTDISAAWGVVEKMREKQVYFNIHADKNSYFVLAFVRADTAPEAICKAALLAV